MRNRFDEQLSLLNRELIQMGALCEEVIALAAKALTTGDVPLAAKVAPIASEIDDMERSIETLALKLLLQQQPVARDLKMCIRDSLSTLPSERSFDIYIVCSPTVVCSEFR